MTPEKIQAREDAIEFNFKMHQEIKNAAYSAMDNIVLLVSTGAFGLSIAFVALLGGKIVTLSVLLMAISWVSLLGAIYSCFKASESNAACSLQNQKVLMDWRLSNYTVPGPNWNMNTNTHDPDNLVKKYNSEFLFYLRLSKYLLIVGILSLFLFGIWNLAILSVSTQPTSNSGAYVSTPITPSLPDTGYQPY